MVLERICITARRVGKNVTLKDIAREIGVSTVTVSKALSNKDGVSEEVREQIKLIANNMGYRPSGTEKKGSKNGNVGILIHKKLVKDNGESYYLKMYQNLIQALAKKQHYAIMEIVTIEQERDLEIPNIIENNKVDGIIILGSFGNDYIGMIKNLCDKVLLLDVYNKKYKIDTILSDRIYGSYKAAQYLIKNGHNKIGFVGNIVLDNQIMDCYLGVEKALLEQGYRMKEEWIVRDCDKDGIEIDFKFPDKNKMPTAFVCSCDEVGYRLIKHLEQTGYRVPEEISVIGFGNDIFAALSPIALTTIDINIGKMTEIAADIIIRKMNQDKYYSGIYLVESELVIRDSVNFKKNKEN